MIGKNYIASENKSKKDKYRKNPRFHKKTGILMAENEGFEPSRQLTHPTPLAGVPLRPLE